MSATHPAVCFIVPPHILEHLAVNPDSTVRRDARVALEVASAARGQRIAIGPFAGLLAPSPGLKRRTVYDGRNGVKLPGALARSEGSNASPQTAVNEAYDFAGDTYDFYAHVFSRHSVDGRDLRLDSTVHYRRKFNNAYWNGLQMVYGDGDGVIFGHFTSCLEIIGHELTHGVTQFSSALEYEGQSGALNEHFSDVMGSLVKQWKLKQSSAEADWLIGSGLLMPGIHGVGVRSLKAPGTAYDDPKTIGRDPQPAHMKHYVETEEDNGGVHINSGIPNRAFYKVATTLGGHAWEKAGAIWFRAFTKMLSPQAAFADAAKATRDAAGDLFGVGGREQSAVTDAWKSVGITVAGKTTAAKIKIRKDVPRVSMREQPPSIVRSATKERGKARP